MSPRKTARTARIPAASAGAAFDLATRYMAETLDVPIPDPLTGKPSGLVFTITSQYSKEARAAVMSATKLRVNEKGEVEADSAAELADTILDQLVAVTRSWNAVVNGEPLPCTPANVRALLTDERTAWIRPPVQSAYLSLSRFFGSAKPS